MNPSSCAELPEPPYYAVIFPSVRTEGDNGFNEMADRLDELVKDQPGYLGMDNAREPGGFGITVSYWRSLEDIARWKAHVEHAFAQGKGRSMWYGEYAVHIARVERSYRSIDRAGN